MNHCLFNRPGCQSKITEKRLFLLSLLEIDCFEEDEVIYVNLYGNKEASLYGLLGNFQLQVSKCLPLLEAEANVRSKSIVVDTIESVIEEIGR